MARYVTTIESPRPQEDVFAYLSDFSTTREWDPGVVEAERLDEGPIVAGSRVRLVADFMGRKTPLVYEVTAIDPPHSVPLRGENATVVSLDTMTFEPTAAGGTRIVYDADLTLKGPLRLADPLLKLIFNRIGDKAAAGLREAVGAA
jgi:carbon monoxide dehydrogenase subunit G